MFPSTREGKQKQTRLLLNVLLIRQGPAPAGPICRSSLCLPPSPAPGGTWEGRLEGPVVQDASWRSNSHKGPQGEVVTWVRAVG